HMINSLHKTLFRPSIDSPDHNERKRAVEYSIETLDFMESAGIYRMVLHSFSDLPAFFCSRAERANKVGFFVGSNAVKIYGILAPALRAYRETRKNEFREHFMHSLAEIAKYAVDKSVNGKPIEIVFEEHYSDAIDYEGISYGRGDLDNVIQGVDTAHRLIRTGHDTDLSEISRPIHFHAVDTNGLIDDHRTIGKGKVNFEYTLAGASARLSARATLNFCSTRACFHICNIQALLDKMNIFAYHSLRKYYPTNYKPSACTLPTPQLRATVNYNVFPSFVSSFIL
ncbi:MAG TPA: hypothetical protein VGJ42_01000, partial [Nitrososphaera sp.]